MLRLLTDEHISPIVAKQGARRGMDIVAVRDWQGGQFLSAPDDQLLSAAHQARRTLVTFDLRTIPTLLREWAEQGVDHSGVILIDEKSIAQHDIGSLVAALAVLSKHRRTEEWSNRVVFLKRVQKSTK